MYFTPEIEAFYSCLRDLFLFFSMTSLRQHIQYFNFRCKIKLDHHLDRKTPRRPLSAAPVPSARLGGKMARPKSSTSLPSELMSETGAMSRSNTTSELRERCNRRGIREREKK